MCEVVLVLLRVEEVNLIIEQVMNERFADQVVRGHIDRLLDRAAGRSEDLIGLQQWLLTRS